VTRANTRAEGDQFLRFAVGLANTRFGDGYLFGGHRPQARPYDVAAPEEVVGFPSGFFGFPECRGVRAGARRARGDVLAPVHGARRAGVPAGGFVSVFDDYAVDPGAADRAELEVEAASDVMVLTIVRFPRTRREPPTTNLQGPLAFNLRTRRAKQVAVSEREWGLRGPVDLSKRVDG
jgi:hypothetical protein